MVAQNYKVILQLLYDEFGDDLKEIGKEVLINQLSKEGQPANKTRDIGTPAEEEAAADVTDDSIHEIDKQEPQDREGNVVDRAIYYDAVAFEQYAQNEINASAVAVMSSTDVANAITDLITMAGEVRKFEEAQITVRSNIAAQRDIALARIEVQKAALMTYLDKSFDERKENFHKLFSVIDDALEKDNMQELAMGLESIIKLADSSPFKDLETIEATAAALTNPNHTWDF